MAANFRRILEKFVEKFFKGEEWVDWFATVSAQDGACLSLNDGLSLFKGLKLAAKLREQIHL